MEQTQEILASTITEYKIHWPSAQTMSTHELICDDTGIYVTGQNMNCIAKCSYDGQFTFHQFENKSGPHGLLIDKQGRVWISFEFEGRVICLNEKFEIIKSIDVKIYPQGSDPINPAPHGITLDADGETIWFTGKRTSTVGKINSDGSVVHFELPQLAAMPIFLAAGPDGNIWGTELLGNNILNVSKSGVVKEFKIPTSNSRPIGIIQDPSEPFMWFTQEAGKKIGKIDMNGNIVEFSVPLVLESDILGSLSFDPEGNLWVQCYAIENNGVPKGHDYIVKFDASIRNAHAGSNVITTKYNAQSYKSMMHRIRMGNDGNMWFTEMHSDVLGKITL